MGFDHSLLKPLDRFLGNNQQKQNEVTNGRNYVRQRYVISKQFTYAKMLIRIVTIIHGRGLNPTSPLNDIHNVMYIKPRPSYPSGIFINSAATFN